MAKFEPERTMAKLRQVRDVEWHTCEAYDRLMQTGATAKGYEYNILKTAWFAKCERCKCKLVLVQHVLIYSCRVCENDIREIGKTKWGCEVCKTWCKT